MSMGSVGFARGRLAVIATVVCAAAVAVIAATSPAEAARRKKVRHVGGYSPPFAAMVVDVKSGRTLHAVNEDALRHPASVTKVMTLYLLFEQIERGRYTMNTPLRVSARAAAMAPSKIGFDPGDTIEVEDAAKALITKSANDVASTIGENIAGSEEEFAEMMTRKARSLGMMRTVFKNASGLPNPEQVTTARDLTILARAIQERFPRYYPMFGTRNFNFAGSNYRNHNKLLGRVEGVDGIKTGYTRASGFNLMTSARADGRHIVSIILGGRSGASRDHMMAGLVQAHLPRAAGGARTAPMVAEAQAERPRQVVAEAATHPAIPSRAMALAQPAVRADVAQAAPVPPVRVQTRGVKPLELSAVRPVVASAASSPFATRWSIGAQPAAIAPSGKVLRPPANVDSTSSISKTKPTDGITETADAKAATKPEDGKSEAAKSATRTANGWVIQLGATDNEGKARDILASARSKTKAVSDASGFTEKVEKGGSTLFRARFAGFDDSKDANDACSQLKRNGFSCFATRG